MTLFRSAALTDIGRVRRNNEDRFVCDETTMIFGVADGVGGLPGGAEAAQESIDVIVSGVTSTAPGKPADLVAIVHRANERVQVLGARISPAMGIGSTLTFGIVYGGSLHLAHVGDSRCYGWRDSALEHLTEDHSVENEARMRRAKGEVVYYHEANRNALTRCIGMPTPPLVDLLSRPLLVGDRYLFCTDGVTRMVRDAEIGEFMGRVADPADIVRDLIALAIRRGGPDNATAVLVVVAELE